MSITVVPPRQHASRSRSQTPFDHDFKSRAPPASAHSFIGNNTEGTSSYSSVVSSNAGYRRYDSDSRVSPSSGVSGGSYTSSTANPPPLKPPRASSNHAEDSHSTRLKELYYRKQLENSGDFFPLTTPTYPCILRMSDHCLARVVWIVDGPSILTHLSY